MLAALVALTFSADPVVVTEPLTGVSVTLPPMCVVLPAAKYDAKACAPLSEEDVASLRGELEMSTSASRVIAMGLRDGMRVLITQQMAASRRKGKVPPGFVDHMATQIVASTRGKASGLHQVETYNGVTVLRVDFTTRRGLDPETLGSTWTVPTPTSDIGIAVVKGTRKDLYLLGRDVLRSLSVPEKQRIDLTGKTPAPEE